MDLLVVVAQLRLDLANINSAIASLERLQSSTRGSKRSPQSIEGKIRPLKGPPPTAERAFREPI